MPCLQLVCLLCYGIILELKDGLETASFNRFTAISILHYKGVYTIPHKITGTVRSLQQKKINKSSFKINRRKAA